MSSLLDLIGRVFISVLFLLSAYSKILNYSETVNWMEGFGVPGFLLIPTIALEIILPILIIVGYHTRLAATLLALFSIVTAFIFHSNFADQMQMISFLKNIGLAGGFILVAVNGPKNWAIESKKKYVRL
ncbi:DoxX family protein [Pelagibacteraceae bacterium]|jgi:putative oxidoreductase|nr:DoxX family protein [Pelagibacteraceae bacterium]MDB9706155.1 DoxX family protein [Pelagibacteraceae bacterium]MDC0365959.1 DoxX family protein [Pelagibacteraceae bacterium]|tara:strand:- start:245 stop:631 length:387 start_codon:yes stop_codon:yes gene_type:complete